MGKSRLANAVLFKYSGRPKSHDKSDVEAARLFLELDGARHEFSHFLRDLLVLNAQIHILDEWNKDIVWS